MNINYSIESRGWDTDVCGYIQKHDLVFRTPVCDPLHGIPMGDGDTGTLLHIEPDALLININKTDLWNKSKNEDPVIHTDYSANVHGAVLKIDFGCPVFEDIYSRHYEARLALGNATAGIKAQTPFCDVDITAFASHDAGVTIIRGKTHYREKMSLDIILKRWGSRIFPYWYAAHYGSCEDGLDGTEARTDGNTLDIVQTLNGNAFCVSVKAVCGGICSVKNSRTAVCASKAASEHEFLLYISVGVNPDAEAVVEEAHAKINTACAGGFDALYSRHCAEWSEFWNKSFISLPKENDFIENLWYLNLYYANSEMRGKSPHHFTNGIWTNYHDFVPWNNIFHYNTQLSTFPLEAANHPELLETYYNYRISQLPAAREYAAKHKGKSGAFYTDVSDFMGRMQPQEFNCTCGAQIAMALYDHYRYSNDEMYLRRILPVMHSVGEFYIDMLTMGDDGYYHIHNTLGYEGSPMLDDSITDLAMIRILFAALIKHLPEDEGALFAGRLERLTPYETADFVGGEVENGIFLHGIGKGKAIFCDNVLSVGRLSGNGRIMRKTHGLKELDYYGFPDTEMAPVFPSGNVGLKDKESVIFKQIKNSVCLHHPAIPEDAVSEGEEFDGMCMGWCLMPVYMARLGMAEELQKQLYDSVSTWCAYPNGMSMEGPYENFNPDINMRWKKYRFGEVSDGRKAGIYSWNFRHFNYEALPIMSAAVNEMLLQSYDGIIRILPAMDKNADVRYSLAAVGGYKVDLRCRDGIYDIYISAKRDGECKIALPDFESKPIFENAADGYKYSYKLKGDIYIITLREGDILRIYCASCDDPAYDKLSYTEDFKRNEDVKFLGHAMLGEEKTF